MDAVRILGLADAIQNAGAAFSMDRWLTADISYSRLLGIAQTTGTDALIAEARRCCTRACLAGWTVLLYGDDNPNRPFQTIFRYGQRLLDLTDDQARCLFAPRRSDWPEPREIGRHYSEVTPAYAARVLRHFARTGQVDWMLTG